LAVVGLVFFPPKPPEPIYLPILANSLVVSLMVPREGLTFFILLLEEETIIFPDYLVDWFVGEPSLLIGPRSEKTVLALKFLANLELP
jgi:hypothetical protein